MGKLLTRLEKQLKTENKQDAENCLKIYNYLVKTTLHVWEGEWNVLVNTKFGTISNENRTYKPTKIGEIFLKGLTKL